MMNTNEIRQKQMEGAWNREQEERKKLSPIRDHYNRGFREIYTIGETYQIVEFEFDGEILFDVWVEYKRVSESSYTLDGALLIAIAAKNNGRGTQAATYAAKVLGVKEAGE